MRIMKSTESRTQKARGILSLANSSLPFKVPGNAVFQLPLTDEDREALEATIEHHSSIFVRPCPTEARHGFVDSRRVSSVGEVDGIAEETVKVDPNGELVAMKIVEASVSAIVTPQSIAIGPGHDGATQGNGAFTLPVSGIEVGDDELRTDAGIKDCGYAELVYGPTHNQSPRWWIVQLRNGPMPPRATGPAWVPSDTVVSRVINADEYKDDGNDALRYERDVAASEPGTVVYHPGGSLVSHYGVHAVLKGIPVCFGFRPSVGDKLLKTSDEVEPRYADIRSGLLVGMQYPLPRDEHDALCSMALVAIHQAVAFMGHKDGARLLGFCIAVLLRMSYAASLGEYRHSPAVAKASKKAGGESRSSIYDQALNGIDGFFRAKPRVVNAFRSFRFSRWVDGYGGVSWADCTYSAMALERAVVKFLRRPTSTKVKDVIARAHNVVNCAHNNGPFLSKFTGSDNFAKAARASLSLTVVAMGTAYPVLSDSDRWDSMEGGRDFSTLLGKLRRITVKKSDPEALHDSPDAPPIPSKLGDDAPPIPSKLGDDDEDYDSAKCGDYGCATCYPDGDPDEDYDDEYYDPEPSSPPSIPTAKLNPGQKAPEDSSLQVCLRGPDTWHFQFGTKGKSYISADIHKAELSDSTNEYLEGLLSEPTDITSFASDKPYWEVLEIATDLRKSLEGNHIKV